MKKLQKMAELSWLLGTVLCALGVVLCTKADLGLSMFAAPPYILHVVLRGGLPWYTQGVSEYVWQSLVLVVMCLAVGRFRLKYLLSFLVAVGFGMLIDGWLYLLGGNGPYETLAGRIVAFCAGQMTISLSVAMVFRSYMPVQIPECIVMEISDRYRKELTKVKLATDVTCLVLSFALALLLTRSFIGVGFGTVVITLVNAPLIRLWGKLLDKFFAFDPMFPKMRSFLNRI